LVIAIDVIHATPDLRSTLRNVQTLLRPGGWFVLGEIDTPFLLLVDMVFGLTDGWWSFQDHDLRPDYPLLRRNQWLTLLEETGFQEVRVVSESQDESIPAHGVYLMKAPATPAPLRASSGSPAEEEILPAADGSEPTARSLEPRPLSMLPGVWILLADSEQDSVALQLSRRLTERGHTAKVIPICESGNPWDAARTALDGDTLVHGVIYLAALTMPEGNDFDTATLLEQHRRFAHLPVALAQGLAGADILKAPARLWFVTRNALAVKPDDCPDCMQAPLQGLSRVVDSGLREFNTCAVDLSAAVSDTDLDLFCEELFHSCREDQIAYRGEGRYVPTLRRALPSSQRRTRRLTGAEQPCRLSSRQSGVLDHLALQTMGPSVLGEDEVEVEVRCAALNFRDIMKALRIYPSDAPDAEHIGDEYSGVITRVGARVTSFKPGDRVCGTWTGTFRSHLVLPAFAVLPIPDNLTFEEASTPIVAFDTAYTALHRVAHIQSGERLLIHSAAGGVGLAALYLGMSAGAEVFTTAGTPLKRDFLRNLGVHHVFDSHSLEFADEIMEVTGGEGVDVVLNSLAGEAIAKGLSCLRWGGRFVEIGKRDVYGNTRLGLRPFQKGLSFTVLDLSARLQPDRLESAISDLSAQFRDGKIDPLPYRALSFGQPSVAFRYMAQGKHIGKIVLSLSRERFSPAPILKTTPLSLSPDETYLITGGLRGFGQAIGRYLCEKGARHFVLISRSGQPDAEGAATIDFLRTSGATVRTYGVDVASYDDMRSLLDEVRRDMPPLGGILHAAVVYADELLIRMTADKFEEATRPKMLGAWNLHLLTLEDPVHTFILFSSISTVIATPTQPNYVAANTFLEELIHYRRRIGKPGLAVSWDRLRDTGYVARSRDFAEHAQRMGWHGITTAQALQALESLIVNEAAHMCVCDFDFGSWANHATFTSRLNRFREVVAEDTAQVTGDRSQRIRQEIYSSSPEQRMGRIETFLIDQVAHILRVPPGKIDGKAPLNEQGLDSLMAVELLSVLEGKLGIPIPTSHMVNAPTIEQLSGKVLELLQVESSAPPSTTAAVVVTPTPPLRPPDLSAEEGAVQDLPRLVDFVDAACPTFPSFPALLPPPRKILLTGANGFIGAYLLDSLLRGTEAEVLCLVRAESDDNAAQRIIHSADIYHLASVTTHGHDRWQAIAGDLDQSAFGLSPERFARLADEVDAVGHLGAAVSHIAGYQQLRRTNVLGTLEVIRLASLGKPKLIHFASSVAVFDASGDRKLEDQPPDDFAALHGGYGQSKAVCERLLVHGRSRGLRATIYRIGPVAADVLTGAAVQRDFVWLIAQTSLELGVAPRSDLNIYLTPIDFVARVMNRAMSGNLSNQTLHLVSPHSISFDELFDAAEAYGYEFSRVTPSEWVEQAKRTSPVFPLAPYFAFGKETVKWISRATNLPKLDASRLLTFAQSEGLQAAPLDRKTRIALVESLARSGVLPPRNKPKAVK
jgi:thioester reductase-like protein